MSARVKSANRKQLCFDVLDYDTLIPEDHAARIMVAFVEQLALFDFYALIKARENSAGRPATDPRLLLCLWLYATVDSVGSARTLSDLCQTDNAYRWICGGVQMNYHTLSDFRTAYPENLDDLLTNIVSSLLSQGTISLKSIIIDGTKVKASAGKQSFKTRKKLHHLKKQTRRHIEALRRELDDAPQASSSRIKAARECAQNEMEKKVEKALSIMPEIEALKEERKKKVKKGTTVSKAKVSTTDPDARIMKFADGSVKAGYNCQIGIDAQSMIILSVEPSQQGNDKGLLKPMVEKIAKRYDKHSERVLVDGGYRVHQDIIDLAEHETPTLVYSPLQELKKDIKPESLRKRKAKEAKFPKVLQAYYKRMRNNAAGLITKQRSRIETVNGIIHNRLRGGFKLRGIEQVKSELLLHAIGQNIITMYKMAAGSS